MKEFSASPSYLFIKSRTRKISGAFDDCLNPANMLMFISSFVVDFNKVPSNSDNVNTKTCGNYPIFWSTLLPVEDKPSLQRSMTFVMSYGTGPNFGHWIYLNRLWYIGALSNDYWDFLKSNIGTTGRRRNAFRCGEWILSIFVLFFLFNYTASCCHNLIFMWLLLIKY